MRREIPERSYGEAVNSDFLNRSRTFLTNAGRLIGDGLLTHTYETLDRSAPTKDGKLYTRSASV